MEQGTTELARRPTPEWPRALGLFGAVLATSAVAHPGVVIGVPLALLLAAAGFANLVSVAVVGLVILIVAGGGGGMPDGLWYAERAWAVLLGGTFLASCMLAPAWRLTSRALAAAAGSAVVAGGVLAFSGGSWASLDGAVTRSMQRDMDATINTITVLGGRDLLSPEMVQAAQDLMSTQVSVFPALLGIESLAALGLAWWARSRLLGASEAGLARLRDFRFNDHLIWVLVTGLLLLVAGAGDALARVGSNTVVFMGALYALRGAAVFVFVSGGGSVFSLVLIAVLLVLAPVVPLGTAALIGVGDTWLDMRAHAPEDAA